MRLFLLVLLFLSQAAFGQGTLEVIPLRYRTADQVIPILRPLLEPGGALSGQFNQLIVRTSPANLAQIRQALEAIDQPQRRLTISVRFDGADDRFRGGVQRSSVDERVDQRMQVLEGGRAYISSGQSRIHAQAETGFAVVPRVSGSSVILEIATQQEAFVRGGAIQGQRAVSSVSGRLGEWIELGGASGGSVRSGSGIERVSSEERRIWVKVEEVR